MEALPDLLLDGDIGTGRTGGHHRPLPPVGAIPGGLGRQPLLGAVESECHPPNGDRPAHVLVDRESPGRDIDQPGRQTSVVRRHREAHGTALHRNVRYRLKDPYRDGTTHVIFEPLDFIAHLAALVPGPRVNLPVSTGCLRRTASIVPW